MTEPLRQRLFTTCAPRATLLVRLALGFVFFTSGIVKFLFDNQGALRFHKLGLPAPEATAYFVGGVEMAAGLLLVVGLVTRVAAAALVVDMLVAIATSKLPLLLGAGPEPIGAPPKIGLWAFAYAARLDVTMLLCALFLALAGAGAASVDARLSRRRAP